MSEAGPIPASRQAARAACVALLGLGLIAPISGRAETAPGDVAEPGDLKKIETQLEKARERQKQFEAESRAMASEISSLREKLIETAANVQEREQEVTGSEDRLKGLKGAEAVVTAQLARRQADMGDLLAALTTLDRHPPPALAVRPDDALAAIRSAALLGSIVPELRREADDLKARLEHLAALRKSILEERDTLSTARTELSAERAKLQALLDEKTTAQQKLDARAQAEAERARTLSRKATSLKDLIARLEADAATRLPPSRPDRTPEKAPTAAPGTKNTGNTRLAAVTPPRPSMVLPPSKRRFSQAKGLIRPPATGEIVQTFGSKIPGGGVSKGIRVAARPNAQLIAPFDGRIVYAGPFRRYGQLLILSVGEGYHVLLAGMKRIDGKVGQDILAGEPIGMMGPSPDETGRETATGARPTLYIEFRKDGDPIDPRPWLLMSDKKARG
ncbi:murein hydrolase activator EnvC family protein [Parvibaculum sp. MBR-TMA-1.3b-4.2]